jgi:Flp pilus assembly pilin Flp
MRNLVRLFRDKRGVGAVEFALVASLISVAAVVAFDNLGTKVRVKYEAIDQNL